MYISLHGHGGFCCGAKHIYGFSCGPKQKIDPLTREQHDAHQKTFRWMIFVEGEVVETMEDRLKRYLRYLKKCVMSTHTGMNYPSGQLVELTLTSSQQKNWHQTLLDLGFEVSRSWVNSNTHNEIKMYHLLVDRHYDKADEPKPAEPKKVAVKKAPAFQRTTVSKTKTTRRAKETV